MNAKKKQYGQGIGGFIFGLLLATAIIGGILYFLNNTKAEYKEIPQSQELPKPEILVPSSAGSAVASAVSDDSASVEFVDTDELAASDIEDASKPIQSGAATSPTPTPTQPVTKEVQAEQQRLAEEKQRVKQARQKQEAAQKEREAEAQKKAQLKKEQAAEQQKKTESAKPTPEQILNHGNLEKAQKEATESAKAKKETSKKEAAEKQTASSRLIVQMGSYNNEKAADTQRAKLAMIGVSAHVVEATANGKTVYRVQSARLSADAAEDVRKTLQQNGVNSFTRSVN